MPEPAAVEPGHFNRAEELVPDSCNDDAHDRKPALPPDTRCMDVMDVMKAPHAARSVTARARYVSLRDPWPSGTLFDL